MNFPLQGGGTDTLTASTKSLGSTQLPMYPSLQRLKVLQQDVTANQATLNILASFDLCQKPEVAMFQENNFEQIPPTEPVRTFANNIDNSLSEILEPFSMDQSDLFSVGFFDLESPFFQ